MVLNDEPAFAWTDRAATGLRDVSLLSEPRQQGAS
jgi:hypothetical protein